MVGGPKDQYIDEDFFCVLYDADIYGWRREETFICKIFCVIFFLLCCARDWLLDGSLDS